MLPINRAMFTAAVAPTVPAFAASRRRKATGGVRRAVMEAMEARILLSNTYFVTTIADDNGTVAPTFQSSRGGVNTYDAVTLRDAVTAANLAGGSDAIAMTGGVFASAPQTITLTQGQLEIAPRVSSLDVLGLGPANLTISGGNNFRVFQVDRGVGTFTVGHLTVSDGNTRLEPVQNGGGIFFNSFGSLIVNDCTISGNTGVAGGGIFADNGDLSLGGVRVTGNTASAGGGGIYSEAIGNISNSHIDNNTTTGGNGGGIFNTFTLSLTNSSVNHNQATQGDGGGIHNGNTGGQPVQVTGTQVEGNSALEGGGISNFSADPLVLAQCTISGNTVTANGGGILNHGSNVSIDRSTLGGNTATNGGGLYNEGGMAGATINDSTISQNISNVKGGGVVSGQGGGIHNGGTLALTDSTISGNAGGTGGGIYNIGVGGFDNNPNIGVLSVVDCTISANSSSGVGSGGGIFNNDQTGESVILEGSIVSGNLEYSVVLPGFHYPDDLDGRAFAGSYNLLGVDDTASFANHDVKGDLVGEPPRLAALADYGGPTFTMATLPGSPAINAGNIFYYPNGGTTPITLDQRGLSRNFGSITDIGAYENLGPGDIIINNGALQRSMVTSLTLEFHGVVTLAAGAITLTSQGGTAVPFQQSTADRQTYVLTFTGDQFLAGSLPDGKYVLTVHANLVTDLFGQPMAADQSYSFFRLFGDYDGNGTVNNADYFQFNRTFGKKGGVAGFLPFFDFNGDGIINNSDYFQFNKRFGIRIG